MVIVTECLHCQKKLSVQPNELLHICPNCRKKVEGIVLGIVAERSWRWESVIIRIAMHKVEGLSYHNGEDLLFQLVQKNKLEWFGAEDAKTRPDRRPTQFEGMLKYRIPSKK